MIQVPADIFVAMHRPTVRKKTRCTWTLNDGSVVDLTDRVLDYGQITRALGPRLGGFQVSDMTMDVDNSDRFLSIRGAGSESLLGTKHAADYIASDILVEQAVWGESSGWHYLPVFLGVVRDFRYDRDIVTIMAEERTSYMFRLVVPDRVDVDPLSTHSAELQSLLTTYTKLTASEIDTTGTFAFAAGVQADLEWTPNGSIPQLTSIGTAASDLARSGFGMVYADEDGTIKYRTEFPNTSGTRIKLGYKYPTRIDETNAGAFSYGLLADNLVTEVLVEYQGVSAGYRDTTNESKVGRVTALIRAPYLYFMRCARQMARVLFSAYSAGGDMVSFTTHGVGLAIQIDDEVVVTDPSQGVQDTFRIVSKTWTERLVSFVALKENHSAEYLSKSFATFGSTAITSATEYYW